MEPTQLPLRDIHLPPAVGWWPPAIGWWLLAITMPAAIGLIYWIYKLIRKKTAVKSAKKLLVQIRQDTRLDNAQKLTQLSMLLRRVAISTSNRSECAGLTGQKWLAFLDSSMKGRPFTEGAGRLFEDTVYRNEMPDEEEINQLFSLSETWLNAQRRKHK